MCNERNAKTDFAREALLAYRDSDDDSLLEMAARKLGIRTEWLSAAELSEDICAWLGEDLEAVALVERAHAQ
jgi:hypothetical protein